MSAATLHTSHRPVEVELLDVEAPKTVDNFVRAGDGKPRSRHQRQP